MTDRIFRYVRISRASDYILLGWMFAAELGPTHGEWSVLLEWRCDCQPIVEPV